MSEENFLSRKFLWYVYFVVESSIRIFADKILRMAYYEASFQLEMMLSSEFPHTKFLLLIDHPQKLRIFHTAKISGYTVIYNKDFSYIYEELRMYKRHHYIIMKGIIYFLYICTNCSVKITYT